MSNCGKRGFLEVHIGVFKPGLSRQLEARRTATTAICSLLRICFDCEMTAGLKVAAMLLSDSDSELHNLKQSHGFVRQPSHVAFKLTLAESPE